MKDSQLEPRSHSKGISVCVSRRPFRERAGRHRSVAACWKIVLGLMLASCLFPSDSNIQRRFEERLAQSRDCETDQECVIIHPGCPLRCVAAVRASLADALTAYADELISDYERLGSSCSARCVAVGDAACIEQRCELTDPVF